MKQVLELRKVIKYQRISAVISVHGENFSSIVSSIFPVKVGLDQRLNL